MNRATRRQMRSGSAKQYFYTPGLDECAGCAQLITQVSGYGTVVLTAPGQPQLHYPLCKVCQPHMNGREPEFVRKLEQRLVARAKTLGAYSAKEDSADTLAGDGANK